MAHTSATNIQVMSFDLALLTQGSGVMLPVITGLSILVMSDNLSLLTQISYVMQIVNTDTCQCYYAACQY